MSWILPVLDEPDPIRQGAHRLLSVFLGVADITDEIASTWSRLHPVYQAP